MATKIYAEEAAKAIQLYFDHAISDQRFSADEEARLNEMSAALDVSIKFDEKTAALLERFKLFARIDAGQLPVIQPPILLQRGEQCYFMAPSVTHKELRTVTKRVNYSGTTASIKIIKGVRWRVGSISPQRITEDVLTEIDQGALFITSKKVLMQGAKKKTAVPLQKVIHFTVFSDGLQVQKETGKDLYLLGSADWPLAGACLDSAARSVR